MDDLFNEERYILDVGDLKFVVGRFATLHAQKIADKMVSERLREADQYNDTLLAFIDEVQYMQKLYAASRFTQAEKKRDELAEMLDDIMRKP